MDANGWVKIILALCILVMSVMPLVRIVMTDPPIPSDKYITAVVTLGAAILAVLAGTLSKKDGDK